MGYFVLLAFTSAATASFDDIVEFINLAITSTIAPCVAEAIAMPCAKLATNPPALAVLSKSAIDLVAQASNFALLTPGRTGIEPLFRLKTS